MAIYQTRLGSVALMPQGGLTGLTPGSPAAFSATSNGSTTTIVSTQLSAVGDSDDDFVGYLVECVGGTSSNLGQFRRVISYDDSTGTVTLEAALPSASASGDRYRLWIPPHGWWAAQTALPITGGLGTVLQSANYVSDAVRTESADFFVGSSAEAGPWLEVVNAASLPQSALIMITNFSATKAFFATQSVGIAVGDLVQAIYLPEAMEEPTVEVSADPIQREGPVGSYGKPPPARGNRATNVSLTLAFRGPGASRIGSHAEAHMVLRTVCDFADPADFTVGSGSTTSNIVVSSGTPVAGSMYATEAGDILMCSAYSSPNATPSPSLRTAPGSGETCYGITTYTPSEGANSALSVQRWLGDGVKIEVYGALPQISLTGSRGDFLRIACNFTATDGYRVSGSRPWRPKLSTVNPVRLTDVRAVLGGTTLDLISFSVDLGQRIVAKGGLKDANEQGGVELVGDEPTGELVAIVDSTALDQLERFQSGEEMTLLLQAGAGLGFPGILGFWAYRVVYTGATFGDADGLVQITLPFAVVADLAETTLPRWAIGIA